MKFGIDIRGRLTGADLAVRIVQIAAALPMLYFVILSGWLALLTQDTPLTYLFSLGVCSVPRAVALGLSALYRQTSSPSISFCACSRSASQKPSAYRARSSPSLYAPPA